MNAQQMLDFSLHMLTGEDLEAAERALRADPALARQSERLERSLHSLLDDGQEFEPPAGLASRTLQLVANQPKATQRIDWLPRRVPFRLADFAVAATVLLGGLLTLAPAFVRMRAQVQTARCMNQLQQIGMGLMSYATTFGHYPQPPQGHPVGYYGIQLLKSDAIDDPKLLVCPSQEPPPTFRTLAVPQQFDQWLHSDQAKCGDMLANTYAYHAGYRPKRQQSQPVMARPTSLLPLLADGPPVKAGRVIQVGNSPNHGGGGQNVLFSDNHVEWLRDRRLPPFDDDIFLNKDARLGFGLDRSDYSLIHASHFVNE